MTTLMAAHYGVTANERLKQSFGTRMWLSLIAATLLHVLPFRLMPDMQVADWARPVQDVIETVQLPLRDLPPEPQALRRPATPVFSADVSVTETLPVVTWDEARVIPPPSPTPVTTANDAVAFTPYTVAPTLRNPGNVTRALRREYPPTLRDAGIGGTVHLLVHIDMDGRVMESRVGETSGMSALDAAALRVADVMRFRPAMNRDQTVAVWITLPVTFRVR